MIGNYPTSVHPLRKLWRPGHQLWVKRDDQTAERYGGNKVRKLEHILTDARARNARRIVTFGAAGSHHVLATTLYARSQGIEVAAILTPQPATPHALEDLRASLAAGLEALPAPRWASIPTLLAKVLRKGDYLLPPGGSSVVGTAGYLDGAAELALQVRQGALPPPDLIVVPLGSGGTAAGLLAGLQIEGLRACLLAVRVVEPWMAGHLRTLMLANLAARSRGHRLGMYQLSRRLEVAGQYLGAGYGHPTRAGHRATEVGREHGLSLEATYTAKTFAAVLDIMSDTDRAAARGWPRSQRGREEGKRSEDRCILYWHTFSSAPLAPLLPHTWKESEIPRELQQLLLR